MTVALPTVSPVPHRARQPVLPAARGPQSEAIVRALTMSPRNVAVPAAAVDDPLADDDLQLALYCCYELHYRGFEGVDEGWEWSPSLLEARRHLERLFVDGLRDALGTTAERDAVTALRQLAMGDGGPSLSRYMEKEGTRRQMQEFCIHRSAYQLKEADPHTWAIPRLAGGAKAAMVRIQSDEYGDGVDADAHATLFARTMASLDLDPTYGAYLDVLPGTTLATVNLVSLFGLHRRWRGALVGHLALFEMTSVGPMQRYSNALRRFGAPPAARRFYDVHVEADAVHEMVALEEMVKGLLRDEPRLAADVAFGAQALTHVEGSFANALLDAWATGATSLRD